KGDLVHLLKENILVAHNAVFDIVILSHEGVNVDRFICTLKLARFLDENMEIPEHNLQYLRYYLELDVEGVAHEAKVDVLTLEALFKYQYKKMLGMHKAHDAV